MTSLPPSHHPRLLLLAHSCNPEIGSEPGMGWNRALQAAKECSTWVLCDEEMSRGGIERYLAEHGSVANLQFVYVPPSPIEQRLRKVPGAFYFAYNLWHRRAFRIVRDLHRKHEFDLIHQLNLCGFREPGYLWKLNAPFIWGPVGGAQNYPWRFLRSAGFAGAISESIRNVLNYWQMRFGHRVGKAARKAAMFLAATTTNARWLAAHSSLPMRVLLETGVHPVRQVQRTFEHGEPLRILWSGVFEHRKALHLLLEAVAKLPSDVVAEIRILGRGPLDQRWKKLAEKLNVADRCRWLGWLDQPQALEQFHWADVFAFTSLRDTTGNVILESLAAGTPVVCLDHQGGADIVTEDCGIKLPVTSPRDVVNQLRAALLRLHSDRKELARLSDGAIRQAEYYAWDRQGERMAAIYRHVLSQRTATGKGLPSATRSIGPTAQVATPRTRESKRREFEISATAGITPAERGA